RPQEPCSYILDNIRSNCYQVYNYHRLLTWDEEIGLHMDIFKVLSPHVVPAMFTAIHLTFLHWNVNEMKNQPEKFFGVEIAGDDHSRPFNIEQNKQGFRSPIPDDLVPPKGPPLPLAHEEEYQQFAGNQIRRSRNQTSNTFEEELDLDVDESSIRKQPFPHVITSDVLRRSSTTTRPYQSHNGIDSASNKRGKQALWFFQKLNNPEKKCLALLFGGTLTTMKNISPGTIGSCSPEGSETVNSCSLNGPWTVGSCSLEGPGMVGSCSLEGPGMPKLICGTFLSSTIKEAFRASTLRHRPRKVPQAFMPEYILRYVRYDSLMLYKQLPRVIVDSPWYVSTGTLHINLNILNIKDDFWRFEQFFYDQSYSDK
ncbi:unnamed protein product, partial [Timema podura]|nr:unnamed protein product [Timema podura]